MTPPPHASRRSTTCAYSAGRCVPAICAASRRGRIVYRSVSAGHNSWSRPYLKPIRIAVSSQGNEEDIGAPRAQRIAPIAGEQREAAGRVDVGFWLAAVVGGI